MRTLLRLFVLGLFFLPLFACVATTADLDRIAAANAETERRVLAELESVGAGVSAVPELSGAITEAFQDTANTIAEVKAEVAARADEALDPLVSQGGIAGLVSAAGILLLNWHRNRTRATDPRVSNASRSPPAT